MRPVSSLRLLCLLLAGWAVSPVAAQALGEALDHQLQQAHGVRTSDPGRFGVLLAALEAQRFAATAVQRDRIDMLRAFRLGMYGDRADEAAALALAVFDRTPDEDLKFQAGMLAVAAHGATRRFSEGLRLLTRVMSLRHSVVDRAVLHDGLQASAVFYNALGQHPLALRDADEVLAGDPDPRARCAASAAQLEARYHLRALPVDDGPLLGAIERCLAIGEAAWAHRIRLTLVRKLAGEGRAADGIELLRLRLPEIEASGDRHLIVEAHALLADLFHAAGNATSAARHAHAAIDRAGPGATPWPTMAAHRVLYALAERAGDTTTALSHLRQFAAAEKAHLDLVRARRLAFEVATHEGRLQAQQIALLAQQNRALALRAQYDRQARHGTQLLAALLLSLIAGAALWTLHVARSQRALRRLADTDALTGTANRRHFLQAAERWLADSARTGEPVSLVVLDLDHFKQVNDQLGHAAGDRVLVDVAASCRAGFRAGDLVGRLGGEEFAILLPRCDRREAARLADACRTGLAAVEATVAAAGAGPTLDLAASFGVTDTLASGHAAGRLLADADRALYRAKHGGRNRVCVFSAAADAPPAAVPPQCTAAGMVPQQA